MAEGLKTNNSVQNMFSTILIGVSDLPVSICLLFLNTRISWGHRSSSHAGPSLWNKLPQNICIFFSSP